VQGGLGMPDRASYIDPSPQMAAVTQSVSGTHRGDFKTDGVDPR